MTTTLPAGWKPRLSCPFCGSNCLFTEPDEVGSGGQWVSPIHVGCNDCQAEQVGDTEDEAVSRWNARFTPSASAQPARDWELDCDHCNGSGHVFVKHQVAELKTDVQEFKEECECCEGRGFVFAFQDIPEIEEYVKSCRPAIQHEPITVSLDPDPRGVSVGVWQGSHCIYNGAHAVPSAQDDAKDDRQAFEEWFTRNDETKDIAERAVRRSPSGAYVLMQTYTAWDIWQAARASVAAPAAGDARGAAVGAAIERACAELPFGYSIELFVEAGYGGARLVDPEDGEIDLDQDERDLAREINAGIDAAIAAQQGKGGEA